MQKKLLDALPFCRPILQLDTVGVTLQEDLLRAPNTINAYAVEHDWLFLPSVALTAAVAGGYGPWLSAEHMGASWQLPLSATG